MLANNNKSYYINKLLNYIGGLFNYQYAWLCIFIVSAPGLNAGPLDLNWTLTTPTNTSSGADHGCENSGATGSDCLGQVIEPVDRGSFRDSEGNVLQNQRSQFQLDNNGNLVTNQQGGGRWYWHLITGDPNSGFAQEVIIQARGAPIDSGGLSSRGTLSRSSGLSAPASFGGNTGAAAMGNGNDPLAGIFQNKANDTGTGTGHPRRVIVRQIVNDGEMDLTFAKGVDPETGAFIGFDRKPHIVQEIAQGDMTATVDINMSSLDYSQLDTTAPMINTVSFSANSAADFDMATDVQDSDVTAGRFIFVGSRYTGFEYSALDGVYHYADEGGYNLFGISGIEFRNDIDNGGPYAKPGVNYPATDPATGQPIIDTIP